jgi:tetratricopeptide (TPR) repeat protein
VYARLARMLAATALSIALLAGLVAPAAAQDENAAEEGKREAPVIDPTTGKRLSEAIEALNAGKYDEANAILTKLNVDKLSPYERSRVEQIWASIAQSKEDYPGALKHIQAAIASGGLNEQEALQAQYQIAQIHIAQEQWKQGIDALNTWFKAAPNPNSSAYYLLAVAYYQLKDFKNAIPAAEKAIELSEKPQESWLQLLLALRLQQEQYQEALPILKRLVAAAPDKKGYWLQLSAVNSELEKYQDAATAMQLAYFGGLLTEDSELRRLSELLLYIGIPYRAAQFLEKNIQDKKIKPDQKAYETLANSWVAAREFERAVEPLGQAARLHENGDLYVRLAEVQVQREDWPGAQDSLQRALDKGGLRDAGNAKLLMGIALYSQDKVQEAKNWFQQARQHPDERKQADGWLQHIEATQATQG